MNEADETRLRDMLDAVRKAEQFAAGRTRQSLQSDNMLVFALTRAIEIIGEAASQITEETRQSLPDIPRRAIIGMRNKIIHDYISVDPDIVWDVVSVDLPALRAILEHILPEDNAA
jgi:uncharacterized protein with HEPN domain